MVDIASIPIIFIILNLNLEMPKEFCKLYKFWTRILITFLKVFFSLRRLYEEEPKINE